MVGVRAILLIKSLKKTSAAFLLFNFTVMFRLSFYRGEGVKMSSRSKKYLKNTNFTGHGGKVFLELMEEFLHLGENGIAHLDLTRRFGTQTLQKSTYLCK